MTSRADRTRGMPRRRVAPKAGSSSRTWLVGAAVVAVVLLAALAAILLSSSPSSDLAEPASAPTSVSGTALPEFTDPASDPAVGTEVPALSGIDLSGSPLSIGPDDGPMAIVVLAHWCPHCQAEVPVLVDYLESTGMPEGVRLVGVSTAIDEARPNYPPSAWLAREGWSVPTLVDDASSTALGALGLRLFPGFVFVDAEGRVVQRVTGEVPIETFDQIVRSLAP